MPLSIPVASQILHAPGLAYAALVDVETDKAAVAIPSPRGGIVVSIHGEVGEIVDTGQVIVVIDDGSGASARPQPSVAERVAAAPATRRLARELGIDINVVVGGGPGGRVTPDDVQRFAAGATAVTTAGAGPTITDDVQAGAPLLAVAAGIPYYDLEPLPDFAQWGPVDTEPVRSIRRKIARKMTTSMVVVPHVVHFDEADVTEIEHFRREHRERNPDDPSLTLLSFVVKAAVAALKRFPEFNASLDPARGEIIYKRYYNVGLAADTPRGLMVPVLHDADRKSLIEVTATIRELAAQARDGTIGVESLRGGTFTITNVRPLGGVPLAPAINYPEVGILGMGRAMGKAVVFTDPEIAWTGLTESEAKVRDMNVIVGRFPLTALGRARTLGRTDGLVKILSDPDNGRILGAGVVGVSASELIAEATLAIEMGATLEDLMVTIHPHPTLSESLMEAAEVAAGAAVHILPRQLKK